MNNDTAPATAATPVMVFDQWGNPIDICDLQDDDNFDGEGNEDCMIDCCED